MLDDAAEAIAGDPQVEQAPRVVGSFESRRRLAMDAHESQIGRTLAGKYRVDAEIGRGGMAAVFRGLHIQLDRPVAIKVLSGKFQQAESYRERFRREARALSALRSPYTVAVYDFGDDDGLLYIVMELLVGETLFAYLKKHATPGLAFGLDVAHQVLQALDEAHQVGILHRDLKPRNIFLVAPTSMGGPTGPRGRTGTWAKALDFGLAKRVASTDPGSMSVTLAGDVLGTPGYMSPQQMLGGQLDPTSDLYALACVLCDVWDVRRSNNPSETAKWQVQDVVDSGAVHLSGSLGTLPKPLADLLERALAPLPSQRPQSAREWLPTIESLLQSAPSESPAAPATVGGDVAIPRLCQSAESLAAATRPRGGSAPTPIVRTAAPSAAVATGSADADRVREAPTTPWLPVHGAGPPVAGASRHAKRLLPKIVAGAVVLAAVSTLGLSFLKRGDAGGNRVTAPPDSTPTRPENPPAAVVAQPGEPPPVSRSIPATTPPSVSDPAPAQAEPLAPGGKVNASRAAPKRPAPTSAELLRRIDELAASLQRAAQTEGNSVTADLDMLEELRSAARSATTEAERRKLAQVLGQWAKAVQTPGR